MPPLLHQAHRAFLERAHIFSSSSIFPSTGISFPNTANNILNTNHLIQNTRNYYHCFHNVATTFTYTAAINTKLAHYSL